MIDYLTIKPNDKVRVVGQGAPGFAKLGEVLTITEVADRKVVAARDDGKTAFFALSCGAARLELVTESTTKD